MKINVIIFLMSIILCNCAAELALTPSPTPDIKKLGLGSHQYEFEQILGLRVKTFIMANNEHIDYYAYNHGNKPSIIRGAGHTFLSASSGGLWELIGVPYELHRKRNNYLAVTYNDNNVAVNIEETRTLQQSDSR